MSGPAPFGMRWADLFGFLESEAGQSCNKFSLSDVSSFLSKENYRRVFAIFASKPSTRFCMRHFLTYRQPPASSIDDINYHRELAAELELEDASLGYTFIIGETKPDTDTQESTSGNATRS